MAETWLAADGGLSLGLLTLTKRAGWTVVTDACALWVWALAAAATGKRWSGPEIFRGQHPNKAGPGKALAKPEQQLRPRRTSLKQSTWSLGPALPNILVALARKFLYCTYQPQSPPLPLHSIQYTTRVKGPLNAPTRRQHFTSTHQLFLRPQSQAPTTITTPSQPFIYFAITQQSEYSQITLIFSFTSKTWMTSISMVTN